MTKESYADLARVVGWVQNGANPSLVLDAERAQILLDALDSAQVVATLDAYDPAWSMSARTSAETGKEFFTCYVPAQDLVSQGATPHEARKEAVRRFL